ncbi:hypothetical protein D3C78_1023480 [compost metagenome]
MAERFQRAVTWSSNWTTTTAVIDQCIYCFLKHPFFILYDDIRCAKVKQTFQPIVTVNHTTIQVVEVRRCKTSTVKLYHRTKFRRNNWKYIKNHPLRLVAGVAECFDYFQAFDCTITALALCCTQFFLQEIKLFLNV